MPDKSLIRDLVSPSQHRKYTTCRLDRNQIFWQQAYDPESPTSRRRAPAIHGGPPATCGARQGGEGSVRLLTNGEGTREPQRIAAIGA
jgi:hypothetical protein